MSLARTPPAPTHSNQFRNSVNTHPPPPPPRPKSRASRSVTITEEELANTTRPSFLSVKGTGSAPRNLFPQITQQHNHNNTNITSQQHSHFNPPSLFQAALVNHHSTKYSTTNDVFLNQNGKRPAAVVDEAEATAGNVIDLTATTTTGNSPSSSAQQQAPTRAVPTLDSLSHNPKRPKVPATLYAPPVGSVRQSRTEREKKARREKAEQHEKMTAEGIAWRQKYKKALPSFVFYFDTIDPVTEASLQKALVRLGASVDSFFSKKVTHIITTRAIPLASTSTANNKENSTSASTTAAPYPVASTSASTKQPADPTISLAGPVRSRKTSTIPANGKGKSPNTSYSLFDGQRVRPHQDSVEKNPFVDPQDILTKASEFGLKIWKLEKAQRFLARITSQSPSPAPLKPSLSLPSLLRSEQLFGTRERDPFVPRADTHYFSPKSCYVLVEDTTGEHRPIVVKEYEKPKKDHDPAWPVLWGGIEGRTGFYHYDGPPIVYEARIPLSTVLTAPTPVAPIIDSFAPPPKPAFANRLLSGNNPPNLRRAVSLNQLHRNGNSTTASHSRAIVGGPRNGEYLAASGNSQIITSNIASGTSTRDSLGGPGHAFPNKALQYLSRNEVATRGSSLRVPGLGAGGQPPKLKRSVSVETGLNKKKMASLRDKEREEAKKPGYCENCRVRYDDFKEHVVAKKHRRFAEKKSNWVELDALLDRIDRPLHPHLLYDPADSPGSSSNVAEGDSGFYEGEESCGGSEE